MRASSPPTGTVTFLFSDIEGSTGRWDRDPVAMQDALRRHDAIVREAIEANAGYVFKTIGDAFCAAFSRAQDAAASAIAAQRGLARADFAAVAGLRIRIALHTGVADERDGDYFGTAVNRVARLLSVSSGGQTVLTAATTELVRATLAPDFALRDLGDHRLKDLSEPERIAELVVPDLPSDFPPLRSLDASRTNLPTQLLPIVGRRELVAEIDAALLEARLVTLVATGGVGKTRIALHVAGGILERFADGVWFVELAAVPVGTAGSPESGVAARVLAALGLRETVGRTPLESVQLWLASREALLVFDNCEHVIAEAALVASAVLARCPRVRMIATSREPLRVAGERIVHVGALRLPQANAALTAADALSFEGIALFVERARALDRAYALSDAHAPVVAEICRRLDGIALAIELAASRVRMLPPPQLAKRLDERFRLLTGGRREAEPRQATLHATIAWSYELLDERERRVFESLGVFMSAWTLDAAVELCGDDTLDAIDAIDAIEALAGKSLIAVERDSDATVYRLLESTRAFALMKLRERGNDASVRARHAAYALRTAEALDLATLDTPSATWEQEAAAAGADLRAALAWSLRAGNDALLGVALAANLRWYWTSLAASDGREEVRYALDVAARIGCPPAIVAKLEIAAATLATVFGEFALQAAHAERAIALLAPLGDRLEAAIALRMRAQALYFLGRIPEAVPLFDAALGEFRALGQRRHIVLTLDTRGVQRTAAGSIADARNDLEEAVRLASEIGYERALLFLDCNLAEAEFALGNVDAAIRFAERALGRSYAKHEPATFAIGWSNLGMYYGMAARWTESDRAGAQALACARESALKSYAVYAFQIAAGTAIARGDARGVALLGYADAALERLGVERGGTETAHREFVRDLANTSFDAPSIDAALRAGAALSDIEAARLAWPAVSGVFAGRGSS